MILSHSVGIHIVCPKSAVWLVLYLVERIFIILMIGMTLAIARRSRNFNLGRLEGIRP